MKTNYNELLKKSAYTKWEKFTHWIAFLLLKDRIEDVLQDMRVVGFQEGHIQGFSQARKNNEQGLIDLYEQGKHDGRKELSESLASINPDNIIDIDLLSQGILKIAGEQITEEELKNLREEAVYLKNCRIWTLLVDTIKTEAQKTMFYKSQNFEDMRTGKMMLYNLRLLEIIVNRVESYKINKPQDAETSYGRVAEYNAIGKVENNML